MNKFDEEVITIKPLKIEESKEQYIARMLKMKKESVKEKVRTMEPPKEKKENDTR